MNLVMHAGLRSFFFVVNSDPICACAINVHAATPIFHRWFPPLCPQIVAALIAAMDACPPPPEDDFDPDDYIRTAVTYGRLDVVEDWLPHHRNDRRRVSQLVLFPAAMFGQFELLSFCLDHGRRRVTYDNGEGGFISELLVHTRFIVNHWIVAFAL